MENFKISQFLRAIPSREIRVHTHTHNTATVYSLDETPEVSFVRMLTVNLAIN